MNNDSNELTVNLIRALVENMADGHDAALNDWQLLSMIIGSYEGQLNSTSGYAYLADGTITAVASSFNAIKPALDAYMESYYKSGEKLPVAVLVQFDRTTGKYSVTFEDTDEDRWKVTPRNFKEIREELRPQLG